MRSTSATVGQVWHQVISVQPTPATAVVAGAGIIALLVGRRLRGIRLHSDTSGVTLSRGKPHGPGMVATAAAGYLAPPLLGFACATLLAFGHITALLWLTVLVLIAMLI